MPDRRTVLQVLFGLFVADRAGGGVRAEGGTGARGVVRYRADAVVSLFGVPIFSRRGVGSGLASVDCDPGADGVRRLRFRFAGGSWPERAGGLNKFGLHEETVAEGRDGGAATAQYFGFMTSTPEESMEEARRKMKNQGSATAVTFAAVQGVMEASSAQSVSLVFEQAGRPTWGECERIAAEARRRLDREMAAATVAPVAQVPGEAASAPFLYTVMRAVRRPERKLSQRFTHGRRRFRLETEKWTDAAAAGEFAGKRLTGSGEPVERLQGTISGADGNARTHFRLWCAGGGEVPPLRIELRPRSYLQLVFEAERDAG